MRFWSYRIARILLWPIMKFVGRVEVIGRENVPLTGGVMICANHVSCVDPPTLAWAIPRLTRFMGKIELFEMPVLGTIVRSLNAFPVHRGTADRTALKTAIETIQAGLAVAMFPEGTISFDGTLLEPQAGAGMIALRSNAVIIPCALVDTEKLMPPDYWWLKFSRVKVVFGEPVNYIDVRLWGGRKASDEVSRRIMSAIGDLLKVHRIV